MPTKHCAFANCSSDSRYPQNGVTFVPFVKPSVDEKRCRKWIHACRRTDLRVEMIKKHSYVCSKHFIGGNGPTPENPDPVPATTSKIPLARTTIRRKHMDCHLPVKRQRLLSDTIGENADMKEPTSIQSSSKGCWTKQESDSNNAKTCVNSESAHSPRIGVLREEIDSIESTEEQIADRQVEKLTLNTQNVECQTDYEIESIFIKLLQNKIRILEEKIQHASLRIESCKNNAKKFKFYSGLSYEQFTVLWRLLGSPTTASLQTWLSKSRADSIFTKRGNLALSLENQLFLTLVRLRCGFLVEDLSYRFSVSSAQISKITTTWIQLMYTQFKKLDIFPSAEATRRKGLPKSFKRFKNIRVIIDGFEIAIQRSNDYRQQGNTYSTYKSRNTVKFLVGVVPTGGCCFMSDGFEGCISDKEIVSKSGLLDRLDKQDLILADRGFNIADLCNKIGCSVLIPPFLKGRARLTKQEVRQTRDIAAARIHVERFIGRIKEFRVLQRVIPKTMLSTISQIVFVIAMLVNFQSPLVE